MVDGLLQSTVAAEKILQHYNEDVSRTELKSSETSVRTQTTSHCLKIRDLEKYLFLEASKIVQAICLSRCQGQQRCLKMGLSRTEFRSAEGTHRRDLAYLSCQSTHQVLLLTGARVQQRRICARNCHLARIKVGPKCMDRVFGDHGQHPPEAAACRGHARCEGNPESSPCQLEPKDTTIPRLFFEQAGTLFAVPVEQRICQLLRRKAPAVNMHGEELEKQCDVQNEHAAGRCF